MSIIEINPEFFNNDAQTSFDPLTHANPGLDIDQLSRGASNILFEGIRGTGKTHILKMIRNNCLIHFDENRVLPIYISLAQLSQHESLDEDSFRIQLYISIVSKAIEAIKSNQSIIEQNGESFRLKLLRNKAPLWELFYNQTIPSALEQIEELAQQLNHQLLAGDIKFVTDSTNEKSAAVKTNLVELNGKSIKKEQSEYLLQRISHHNASQFIIEFFKGLYDILELNYSLLLLDEVSGISDKAQIEVFRLLKLIRAATESAQGTNFLYFIGSVYPQQSTNYPSKEKGHQFDFIPGEDCSMEYLEMDVLTEEYEMFFKFLTKKRLSTLHPNSKDSEFWLFEDERAFLLAAFVANGLPRRYFELLKSAYGIAAKKYSSIPEEKKLDLASIGSAIQLIVDNQILNESQLSDKDFEYLEKTIIPRLQARNIGAETRNESRGDQNQLPVHLFLTVSRSDRNKLGNLIYRGVIHNLSRTRKSKNTTSEYKGIMMLLDLAVAYNYRVFNISKAVEYFHNDLRDNAKRGYLYYSTITLEEEHSDLNS